MLYGREDPASKGQLSFFTDSVISNWRFAGQDLPADSAEQVATGFSRAFTSDEFAQLEAAQTRRVVQRASQDPQFAARYDQLNKDQLGASITELDDVGGFIEDTPTPPSRLGSFRPCGPTARSRSR